MVRYELQRLPGAPLQRGTVDAGTTLVSLLDSLQLHRDVIVKLNGRALPDDYDIRSSPHAWGCFQRDIEDISFVMVFPTCVGVFPHKNVTRDRFVRSSPHAWGCFRGSKAG